MFQKMMKKMRRNNKKGFTLIELIVVIAILAILAAILVPSMVGYLNNAKEATANANARTVYSAASSAAAACIASGKSVASITGSGGTAGKSVGDLASGNDFEKELAKMLGSTFAGTVTVTVDSGSGAITETQWTDGTSTGTYTVGGSTPAGGGD